MRPLSLVASATIFCACASSPPPQAKPAPIENRPLERMAGQQIVVFPIQYFSSTDTLGWQRQIGNRAAFLASVDDQIQSAFSARGLGAAWTFGPELERASKMNSILMTDARSLAAEYLRGRILPDATVRDPLASQVRGLVGLKGSRYAILPVELRLQSGPNGTGVATLRLVMIDSRLALIKWVGEVASDPMNTLSPALTASLASHFADLVVAP